VRLDVHSGASQPGDILPSHQRSSSTRDGLSFVRARKDLRGRAPGLQKGGFEVEGGSLAILMRTLIARDGRPVGGPEGARSEAEAVYGSGVSEPQAVAADRLTRGSRGGPNQ